MITDYCSEYLYKEGELKLATKFREYVEKYAPYKNILPLVHNTTGLNFRNIIDNDELSTKNCSVFKKDLLYLFYGRPAFKVSQGSPINNDSTVKPVCFLIKADAIKSFECIYPFDSGAYMGGYYKDCIN